MSIWGKVIGGVAGFAFGGPLGAILGAVAGHAVDRAKAAEGAALLGHGVDAQARAVAFTTAVIVLSAKLAKVDGHVTRDEVDTFKKIFNIPPDEMAQVGRIWDEARRDAEGYEPYAAQVAEMFAREPQVLEELLGGLFHIAKADGVIEPAELQMLHHVALIFGFGEHGFERLKTIYLGSEAEADPYEVLGMSRGDSNDEIKSAYRKLSRENHPDALMSKGLPQEFIDLATEKMAAINAAYDQVVKARGMK